MKNRPFHRRLHFALHGILSTWRTETSFRTQCGLAVGAILFLVWKRPGSIWCALFALSIGGVLAAELFNTALEKVVDHLHPEVHPAIGLAKDCAAGAVFICSLTSLAVFFTLLKEILN